MSRPASFESVRLGGAQLGMDYGLFRGQSVERSSRAKEIVALASTVGIYKIDTAPSYGDSESWIGLECNKAVSVSTKIGSIPGHLSVKEIRDFIFDSFARSKSSLGSIHSVDSVLLHDERNFFQSNSDAVMKVLGELKSQNPTLKIGGSFYDPSKFAIAIDRYKFDVAQIPLNPFNRSFESFSGAFSGIDIHVRSVFLQGVLLADSLSLPEYFRRWSHEFSAWESWHKENPEISKLASCLNYIKSLNFVNECVVGFSCEQELSLFIDEWSNTSDIDAFPNIVALDKDLIWPHRWNIK